jgi:N-acetylglucosaminyl-diphospho-decaprenol L-rhamnosyltransferase
LIKVIYFLIVNYNSTDLIARLIASLSIVKDIQYQIVIVNNSSQDTSIAQFKNPFTTILTSEKNLGFGKGCNLGIQWIYEQDSQAIIWLINPDAYLLENSLEKIDRFFDIYPQLSIIGTIIYTPTNKIWFAGGYFNTITGAIATKDLLSNTDADYVPCDWVSGCSLLINLRNFSQCPQFDPAYFLYYEDFDFCKRYAAEGHLVAITKQFGVIHQPSSITDRNPFNKIKHSTYSYLLTLERYASKLAFFFRFARLTLYAFILLLVSPKIGLGKLFGVINYFKRTHQ